MDAVSNVVIFGGTGFIGSHLAQHLLAAMPTSKITLVDLLPLRASPYTVQLQEGLNSGMVEFIQWDVRKPIPALLLPAHADIVFNLAAVHREPGHRPEEYFETNIHGAQNVCEYAHNAGCLRIVFTSSISVYGASEEPKNESSLPVPETPYGSSKLVAETIHLAWQAARQGRKLIILRPGVVFGPGENGNVTRLVRSIVKGYFVYLGNRETRKAGGYVKELCFAMLFGLESQDRIGEDVMILNFSLSPPATMETFVGTIRKVVESRGNPLSVPRFLVLGASYVIDSLAKILGINQPVNPVRLRKMFRSTYIDPCRLRDLGYTWRFSIEDAFRDWKHDFPSDFLK